MPKKKKMSSVYEITGQTYARNKQHVINRLVGQGVSKRNILGVKYGRKGTRFKAYVRG